MSQHLPWLQLHGVWLRQTRFIHKPRSLWSLTQAWWAAARYLNNCGLICTRELKFFLTQHKVNRALFRNAFSFCSSNAPYEASNQLANVWALGTLTCSLANLVSRLLAGWLASVRPNLFLFSLEIQESGGKLNWLASVKWPTAAIIKNCQELEITIWILLCMY